ncbi:hypothetical protein D1AOALGA4SA_8467 [Olavius algarvensis Delta 1 endosymbiont]|nr:hypothetical protein D1AOALGA4SA_8467 [Olavius algarvensis Delta 1 endosymbiont]
MKTGCLKSKIRNLTAPQTELGSLWVKSSNVKGFRDHAP